MRNLHQISDVLFQELTDTVEHRRIRLAHQHVALLQKVIPVDCGHQILLGILLIKIKMHFFIDLLS